MKKTLIIFLSFVLLFSAAIGCSNTQIKTEINNNVSNIYELSSSVSESEATEKAEETKTENKTKKKEEKASEKSTEKATEKQTEKQTEKPTQAQNFCYITIECKSILSNMDSLKEGHEDYVPESGIIISKTKYTFKDGESAYDILKSACSDNGIRLTSRETVYGIYVSGINNLDEFDCGKQSGWVYTVNGKSPTYGCGKYTVSKNDEIIFKYVC